MMESLKRLFASCLAAFSLTLLLLMCFRLIEPNISPNSALSVVGDLLVFWPAHFHVFDISGCPTANPFGEVRCLEMSFGVEVLTYTILFFPFLGFLRTHK
jgi:hypothetical protein